MPPGPITDAHALRGRALALRKIAQHIDSSGALELARRAGPDTWVGPTAHACESALATIRARLAGASAQLVITARGLEQRAETMLR